MHPYFSKRGLNISQPHGEETDTYRCIYYYHSSDQLIGIQWNVFIILLNAYMVVFNSIKQYNTDISVFEGGAMVTNVGMDAIS